MARNRKPTVRAKGPVRQATGDSFANFEARLGWGADNMASSSQYTLTYQSRNRMFLEAAYRGSWIVGKAIDAPAEDMTRAGIEINGLDPEDSERIESAFVRLKVWDQVCDTIKWARLYGGALALLLIDGQNLETELDIDTVGPGQFKGLYILDRWMVQPSLQDVVTDYGPDMGLPKYYDVVADGLAVPRARIHHSRVIRLTGVDLPYYQRFAENYWGLSVLEPLWDRLVSFDSATVGIGQLVYRAHLRNYKVDGLREIIAGPPIAMENLVEQINMIRRFQSNEHITLMDAKDEMEVHTYSFSGLSDVLVQFKEQLSGALGIPLVRLFGQSPAGLNSTGESDHKTYNDGISQKQERELRNPMQTLLRIVSMSELGVPWPEDATFEFRSLDQMSEAEKAEITSKTTEAVLKAEESGILTKDQAMMELKNLSHRTGTFSSISNDDIEAAKKEAEMVPPEIDQEVEPDDPDKPSGIVDSLFGRWRKKR
ncbi:DUF1073 domain-containing protein [Chromobacterium haemolyticum]|uniref:DUF1073 domain-containing protein n=1 Tax=Chromobacterium haemolyticum TaxID=394935 RepID=UPI00031E58A0|nr:DUF1073 domain-containing protein [Chromobacterium haemolyticum]